MRKFQSVKSASVSSSVMYKELNIDRISKSYIAQTAVLMKELRAFVKMLITTFQNVWRTNNKTTPGKSLGV